MQDLQFAFTAVRRLRGFFVANIEVLQHFQDHFGPRAPIRAGGLVIVCLQGGGGWIATNERQSTSERGAL